MSDAVVAAPTGHELLLGLAGWVDDDLLAIGRELVAVGEEAGALELLVASLAADRTALPHPVRAGLADAVERRVGGDLARLLPPGAPLPDRTAHAFAPDAGDADATARIVEVVTGLAAVARNGARVSVTWRLTPAGAAPGPLPHPVVLLVLDDPAPAEVLAYQVGAALARAGLTASVEAFVDGASLPPYQRAAVAAAGTPAATPTPGRVAAAAAPEEPDGTRVTAGDLPHVATPTSATVTGPYERDAPSTGDTPLAARSATPGASAQGQSWSGPYAAVPILDAPRPGRAAERVRATGAGVDRSGGDGPIADPTVPAVGIASGGPRGNHTAAPSVEDSRSPVPPTENGRTASSAESHRPEPSTEDVGSAASGGSTGSARSVASAGAPSSATPSTEDAGQMPSAESHLPERSSESTGSASSAARSESTPAVDGTGWTAPADGARAAPSTRSAHRARSTEGTGATSHPEDTSPAPSAELTSAGARPDAVGRTPSDESSGATPYSEDTGRAPAGESHPPAPAGEGSGAASPVERSGSTPAPDRTASHTDSTGRTPPTGGVSAPAHAGAGDRAPSAAGPGSTPGIEDTGRTPSVDGTGSGAPSSIERTGSVPPVGPTASSADEAVSVPPGESSASPVHSTGSASPVDGTRSAAPVEDTGSASPVDGARSDSPVDGTGSASPPEGTRSVPPAEGTGSASPGRPAVDPPLHPTVPAAGGTPSPAQPSVAAVGVDPARFDPARNAVDRTVHGGSGVPTRPEAGDRPAGGESGPSANGSTAPDADGPADPAKSPDVRPGHPAVRPEPDPDVAAGTNGHPPPRPAPRRAPRPGPPDGSPEPGRADRPSGAPVNGHASPDAGTDQPGESEQEWARQWSNGSWSVPVGPTAERDPDLEPATAPTPTTPPLSRVPPSPTRRASGPDRARSEPDGSSPDPDTRPRHRLDTPGAVRSAASGAGEYGYDTLDSRLTPNEQELLRRLQQELAARESGSADPPSSPRNGTPHAPDQG